MLLQQSGREHADSGLRPNSCRFGEPGPGQLVHDLGEPRPRVRDHRRTRLGHERRKPLRRTRLGTTNHRRLHPTTPRRAMSTHPAHPEQTQTRQTPAGALPAALPSRTRFRENGAGALRALELRAAVGRGRPVRGDRDPVRRLGCASSFGLRGGPAAPGTASMAALIAANNMREAAIPLLFAALKIGRRRWPVTVGDVVVGASLAVERRARRTRARHLRDYACCLSPAVAVGVGRTRARPRRLAARTRVADGTPASWRCSRSAPRCSCASRPCLRHTQCPRAERQCPTSHDAFSGPLLLIAVSLAGLLLWLRSARRACFATRPPRARTRARAARGGSDTSRSALTVAHRRRDPRPPRRRLHRLACCCPRAARC